MTIAARFADTKRAWATEFTPYLLFCVLAFAFGNVLFGIDTGSFGSLQALPAFINDFAPPNAAGTRAFPTDIRSIMNSVVWPGKLLGTLLFEPLNHYFGYKLLMYLVVLLQCVGLIVQLTAGTWQTFSGGRVICYFAVGIVENVVPVYVSEIAPAPLRGFLAGIMNVIVGLGNLWGAGMGRAYATETRRVGWLVPVAVQLIPPLFMAIMVPFCVESPRWLILHRKRDEAQRALDRIRPKREVESGNTRKEIEEIDYAVESSLEQTGRSSWLDLFRGNYPRRTFIASMMFYGNQCCGNQFINLYGPTFYTQIGLGSLAFTYNTMTLAIGLAFSIFTLLFVDSVGRRISLIAGVGVSVIFTAVAGGVGSNSGALTKTQTDTVVAALVFVVIGNKIGVNPLCWVVAAEMGGVKMRKHIMSVATSVDVLFAFAMSYGIPYLIGTPGANLGARVGFFFTGTCAVMLLFVIFFVPECTGRSLEEVDELFDRKLPAWRFASAKTSGAGHRIARLEGVTEGSDSDSQTIRASEGRTGSPKIEPERPDTV